MLTWTLGLPKLWPKYDRKQPTGAFFPHTSGPKVGLKVSVQVPGFDARHRPLSLSYNTRGTTLVFYMWGFPKIRGTILGVLIIRTIVFWGLYWGPLILGNYHIPIMGA